MKSPKSWKILLLVAVAVSCVEKSRADVQVDDLNLTFQQALPGSRDPLTDSNGLSNRTLNQELNLDLHLTLWGPLYMTNRVRALTDRELASGQGGQFRAVGWNWQIGLHLTRTIDLYADHFSQHVLDTTYAPGGYPVQDAVGIRFNLITGTKGKETLLR